MNEMYTKYIPLNKTNVCIEFSISTYENSFNPDDITRLLEISPTRTYIQKKKFDENGQSIKETCWELVIPYEESDDIGNQINKILIQLKPQRENLRKIRKMFETYIQFMIVIKVENGEWPSMLLDSEFIGFVGEIGGNIQFDVYCYS